ncbi:hypothetical protein BDR05DRAFT_96575 [Suillus weaverae]|nr:hypothetical protein BDR05DRAFT_96575 [Suillus weaverae]
MEVAGHVAAARGIGGCPSGISVPSILVLCTGSRTYCMTDNDYVLQIILCCHTWLIIIINLGSSSESWYLFDVARGQCSVQVRRYLESILRGQREFELENDPSLAR